jgi:protein-L-isoaspartate(D-aspartate) O-methyltransferase
MTHAGELSVAVPLFAGAALALLTSLMTGCGPTTSVETTTPKATESKKPSSRAERGIAPAPSITADEFAKWRRRMVDEQLKARGITDERVLAAMLKVPRHRFVPDDFQREAYSDGPLPIGQGQTISQPYIVALMTAAVSVKPQARCLDIGTGSGYQAAVLAELAKDVYSIEIVPELAESADKRLQELGYRNIRVRAGDGYLGWPEYAPFDAIIVAAAPDHVPQPLVDQLAAGGKLVIPVGDFFQELLLIEKRPDGTIVKKNLAPVRFVPMTGTSQTRRE